MNDGDLRIRWISSAEVFFVDFGNAHFAVNRKEALVLAKGLINAVICAPAPSEVQE